MLHHTRNPEYKWIHNNTEDTVFTQNLDQYMNKSKN